MHTYQIYFLLFNLFQTHGLLKSKVIFIRPVSGLSLATVKFWQPRDVDISATSPDWFLQTNFLRKLPLNDKQISTRSFPFWRWIRFWTFPDQMLEFGQLVYQKRVVLHRSLSVRICLLRIVRCFFAGSRNVKLRMPVLGFVVINNSTAINFKE